MFTNKVIFITGASSGLGRKLAIELSKLKANLILTARNKEKLTETARLCTQHFSIPLVIPMDVTDSKNCDDAIKQTIHRFGKLDYLILNAGISMWSRFDEIEDILIFRTLMETNYLGPVNCIFHALPFLKQTKGMIVAVSSIQGKIPTPFHSGYCASKHALQSFLDTLRLELKNQIKILTVSPGWIKGTELKINAFRNKPIPTEKLNTHNKEAMSLDFCVKNIVKAMEKKQNDLILPNKYRALPWLKLFLPTLLNYLVNKRLGQSK